MVRDVRSLTRTLGVWRSLVAHTLGVRVVAGSNPATPTERLHGVPKGRRGWPDGAPVAQCGRASSRDERKALSIGRGMAYRRPVVWGGEREEG